MKDPAEEFGFLRDDLTISANRLGAGIDLSSELATSMPVEVDYDCMGVAKNAAGLKDWLNIAAFEIERSGKRAELWKKWHGGVAMTYPLPVSPYL